jgi:phosphatidylinositol glycan class H protein
MLTTTRPTPTTVSYTVSTRSQRGTLTSRLTTTLVLILRLTAALLVLYALLLEFQSLSTGTAYALPAWLSTQSLSPSGHHHPTTPGTEPKPAPAPAETPFHLPFPPLIRALAYGLTLWLASRKGYTSESLLVIRGLGVQTATAGTSFLWGGSTRFIAASAVQDVFIHEAFRGFEVRFYLCIVVEGEEGVVVVFPVSFFGPLSFNYVERLLAGWEMDLWDCFANRITFFCRARCLEERFSKRCGGERGLACTSRRHDNVVLKVFVQVIYRHV